MVCRFNPFYIGPMPPSCCTESDNLCDCPPCSPETGYQEPRPVHEECNKGVTERETKESPCNPPCIEGSEKDKSEQLDKKEKEKKRKHKKKKENKEKQG
ncbi:uncharacterized protein [Drosophila kikkawai]|uniref:Uncharacterized protein n=1 Tax=Drosophila kikkawai TaxID=30033 RepID=A0A6P4JBK8_DROKI|nr:uncharacterized protein LOC108082145 [Drosophila kikkawai]